MQQILKKTAAACSMVALAGSLFVSQALATNYQFGPYNSSNTDSGSCSKDWAQDTFQRMFFVAPQGNGKFQLTEQFKNGSFTTYDATSPGNCETGSNHGSHVNAGIKGTFSGYLLGYVTNGVYNPNGCNAPGADCSTTDGFVHAVFGNQAQFSCDQGYANCSFDFEYGSTDRSLSFHNWSDRSGTVNGQPGELYSGDIANF